MKKERVTPVNIVNICTCRGRPKGRPRKSAAPFQPGQVVHTEWDLCVLVEEAVDEDTGVVGWNCQFDEGKRCGFWKATHFELKHSDLGTHIAWDPSTSSSLSMKCARSESNSTIKIHDNCHML